MEIESSEDTGSVELFESPRSVVRSAWANASLNALYPERSNPRQKRVMVASDTSQFSAKEVIERY